MSVLSLCMVMPLILPMSDFQKRKVCEYEPIIKKWSRENNIKPELVASIIYFESGFHKNVVSSAGACGLMQVIPKWTGKSTRGKKYTCTDLKNPEVAIQAGTTAFRYILDKYTGKIDKALCFYNAGTICIKSKTYYKRSSYVRRVKKAYENILSYTQEIEP